MKMNTAKAERLGAPFPILVIFWWRQSSNAHLNPINHLEIHNCDWPPSEYKLQWWGIRDGALFTTESRRLICTCVGSAEVKFGVFSDCGWSLWSHAACFVVGFKLMFHHLSTPVGTCFVFAVCCWLGCWQAKNPWQALNVRHFHHRAF